MNEITDILKLSPPLLLVVALGCLGKVIKCIPKVPNWIIPIVLPIVGAILYRSIGTAFPLPWIAEVHSPGVVYAVMGFVLGSAAVGFHQAWQQWIGRNDDIDPSDS